MDLYVILVFSILVVSSVAPPPTTTKQYRDDYVYNRKTDAFYKLHIEAKLNSAAKTTCSVEGATLVPPLPQDVAYVHGMLKPFPDIGDLIWVGEDGQTHESAEETPVIDLGEENDREGNEAGACDVMTRQAKIESTVCYYRKPFACKVAAKDAPYDEQCQVYGLGYQYFATAHSCYKVSRVAYTWDAAYAECRSEGAHLAVLNSEAEHQAVWDALRTAPRVSNARTTYFFHAGIRAKRPTDGTPRVFRTVFNETLEQAGYDQWAAGEPNNHQDSEYCGSIFSADGKYNDVDCGHEYSFICEKEVTS